MKRFLPAGERYALLPTNILPLFLLILFTSAPAGSLFSQEIQRVSAGQRVPEEFWTTPFTFYDHETTYTKTLEEYRGKPIILGFWSIYCGACISSFPLLNEAKQMYGDDIEVIPVNSYDSDLSIVDKVMSRFTANHRVSGIVFDEYLKQVFPHVSVPHYIWIRPNGTVGAITVKSFLTMYNISRFVQ